jgi:hypothetical protein
MTNILMAMGSEMPAGGVELHVSLPAFVSGQYGRARFGLLRRRIHQPNSPEDPDGASLDLEELDAAEQPVTWASRHAVIKAVASVL